MIENKVNKDLEKQIDLYVNGKLNTEEIDELWAELLQDGYYLDYMKSVVNVKAVIERNAEKQPKSKIFTLKKVSQYAATAALVLIIGIAGVMNFNSSEGTTVNPIADIGLDVVRDVNGVSEVVTSEVIKQAIQLATEGNTQEAINLLEGELEEASEPQLTADVALNLGSIQYNAGDYASSISSFEIVTQQEDINTLTLEKGYWYLGNAYFQLDQLAKAEEAFQQTYELNGAYSRVAQTYLDALQNAE